MRKNVRADRRIVNSEAGTAGVEFALISFLLIIFLLNGVEFARYSYERMQVENAVHDAVMSVWKSCDASHVPAKQYCPGLGAAITEGLTSTPLGSSVFPSAGSPSEGYYCVDLNSGAPFKLVFVADYNQPKPVDCTLQGDAAHSPGDYITVAGYADYKPIFGGLSLVQLLPPQISSSANMRL